MGLGRPDIKSSQSMLYYSLKKRNTFIHSRNQGNVNKHTVSNGEPQRNEPFREQGSPSYNH